MNEKSEQIDARLNIVIDADQALSPHSIRQTVVDALMLGETGCVRSGINSFEKKKVVVCELPNATKHAFLTAAVTFLGGHGNHPIFKKRIQLKEWFKPATEKLRREGYEVHFLGVYHYGGNVVFVDFAPDTYMKRKMHNSSAFVYTNDLFRAMKDGVAHRVDLHGNRITTFRRDKMFEYVSGATNVPAVDTLLEVFKGFNNEMPFKQWIKGQEAIKNLHDADWPQWRQTEWAGWYLEYKFATYLNTHGVTSIVYQGNDAKKADSLDFDLVFPVQKFYGDLKASDIAQQNAPGNDRESLMETIDRCDRFWYVIYEHETIKDKDCGGEVCKFRYDYLVSLDDPSAKSPTSYLGRMKNRVYFRRMVIIELNRANCGNVLITFHQGHQPNGMSRAPKVCIKKKDIENYQVFHFEA